MLQIRLSNKATTSESGGGAKLPSGETVTVACPDHLVLAELPVAKSLGSTSGVTLVKTIGRRSRRPLGERVHFCVQCDFPIAIYGRLTPCEHAFCLDCARSDSICYLCDERIQKIQTIKMMEGIFICAAPHCFKSFLKKTDFESHVHTIHADLINSNAQKDVKDPETLTVKKPSTSESTVQAPTPRPVQDREDRTQHPHPPPVRPPMNPNHPPMHVFQPQNFDPNNFGLPGNPNMVMGSTAFGQTGEPVMDHGPLLGYPRPWGMGPNGAPFDPSMMVNQGGGPDQGRVGFFPSPNMMQPGNGKDGRGLLAAPPPLPPPPPPLPPPQFAQMRGNFYGGDGSQGYGWQQEKRDGFSGQDQMG